MITATIIKIQKKPSRYGDKFYLVCFKDLEGNSYISYLYPKMRNFSRWKKVLSVGSVLSGLHTIKGRKNIIDADSRFVEVKQ